jgi:hypothetical protein
VKCCNLRFSVQLYIILFNKYGNFSLGTDIWHVSHFSCVVCCCWILLLIYIFLVHRTQKIQSTWVKYLKTSFSAKLFICSLYVCWPNKFHLQITGDWSEATWASTDRRCAGNFHLANSFHFTISVLYNLILLNYSILSQFSVQHTTTCLQKAKITIQSATSPVPCLSERYAYAMREAC